jgi:tRNA (mo5U34)-methyltransferase
VATPAHHEGVWQRLEPILTEKVQGASVLDVGSNAGYFSMQLKRAGAGKVVGLERKGEYIRQAEMCRQIWGLDIENRTVDVEDLDIIQEEFDLVIFAGILYHLKNPLKALETVGRICQDAVVIETEVISEDPRNCVYVRQGPLGQVHVTACRTGLMKFLEADELNSDGSNWWVPDTECVLGMLRTAGFRYFSAPYYLQENRLLLVASKKNDSILDFQALK